MKVKSYEELIAWQRAMLLAKSLYALLLCFFATLR